jgi:hypothetical protein
MDRTDVALALVSQAFLNSHYCQHVEIPRFLERRRKQGLRVFPVILSACDWKSYSWLASTNFKPSNGQTVEEHYTRPGKRERLYLEIFQDLRRIGEEVRAGASEKDGAG